MHPNPESLRFVRCPSPYVMITWVSGRRESRARLDHAPASAQALDALVLLVVALGAPPVPAAVALVSAVAWELRLVLARSVGNGGRISGVCRGRVGGERGRNGRRTRHSVGRRGSAGGSGGGSLNFEADLATVATGDARS